MRFIHQLDTLVSIRSQAELFIQAIGFSVLKDPVEGHSCEKDNIDEEEAS